MTLIGIHRPQWTTDTLALSSLCEVLRRKGEQIGTTGRQLKRYSAADVWVCCKALLRICRICRIIPVRSSFTLTAQWVRDKRDQTSIHWHRAGLIYMKRERPVSTTALQHLEVIQGPWWGGKHGGDHFMVQLYHCFSGEFMCLYVTFES